MTTPGDSGEQPRADQPPSKGKEPPPFDQAETQFAQIPPPEQPRGSESPPADESATQITHIPPPDIPPAYAPPPSPAGGMPPSDYPPPYPAQPPQPPSYPAQPWNPPQPPSYPAQPWNPPQPPSYPAQPWNPPQPGGYPAPSPYQSVDPGAAYSGYAASQPRTNGMAIGSLVASIIAFPLSFFCFGVGGLLGAVVGIVLGIIALNQTKRSGEGGRGFAIAGIAVGGLVVVFALIFAVILVVGSRHSSSY